MNFFHFQLQKRDECDIIAGRCTHLAVGAPTFISHLSRYLLVFHNLFRQRALVKCIEVLTLHFSCPYDLCSRSQHKDNPTHVQCCFQSNRHRLLTWTPFRTKYCVEEKRRGRGWGDLVPRVSLGGWGWGIFCQTFRTVAWLVAVAQSVKFFVVGCHGGISIFPGSRTWGMRLGSISTGSGLRSVPGRSREGAQAHFPESAAGNWA